MNAIKFKQDEYLKFSFIFWTLLSKDRSIKANMLPCFAGLRDILEKRLLKRGKLLKSRHVSSRCHMTTLEKKVCYYPSFHKRVFPLMQHLHFEGHLQRSTVMLERIGVLNERGLMGIS
ncbi:hypothetical protein TNCT_459061 [Trichonephila clavata]|uniref:Uncharacterized protein n=1 Tax=Trichonephila clavata TaxID=2740835 RepID=A0A8X6LXT2_TRICU|nr:hypothetical protein TNCT_459061 [Trichonephila clavata]